MGIHLEVVLGKSAVHGSFKMLGQGTLEAEAPEEVVIDADSLRDLGKSLSFPHFAKKLSLVLVISLLIPYRVTAGDERQPEAYARVPGLIGRGNREIYPRIQIFTSTSPKVPPNTSQRTKCMSIFPLSTTSLFDNGVDLCQG
jgi:hypothetical protein